MGRLMKMKEKYPIKDVRGLGLMIATEFEDSLLQKDVLKVLLFFLLLYLILITSLIFVSSLTSLFPLLLSPGVL